MKRNLPVWMMLSLALTCFWALGMAQGEDKDVGPPLDKSVDYYVVLHTTQGKIVGRFFTDKVPNTCRNFINLAEGTRPWQDSSSGKWVKRPFFNGLTFHRVIPDFMIQGGCPRGTGTGSPGYRFADEFDSKLRHDRDGIWSMANSGPNTNGSQFFITDRPTPHLNDRHSVFGETVEGIDVVKKIARVPKGRNDRPSTPVIIQRCEVLRVKKGEDPATKPWENPALLVKLAAAVSEAAAAPKPTKTDDKPTSPAKSR